MPHTYTSIDQLSAPYAHIYLSPHLDDAALSCGGSIARFAGVGQAVLVVNICCASPEPATQFSPFAQQLHQQWQLLPESAVQQRLQEDATALETLGADSLLLDQLDAIYRRPDAYYDNATLFGRAAPDDQLLAALHTRLNALVARYPTAIFYAPLGVGHHVDHQVAHQVATDLARSNVSVAYYEDFPYVVEAEALEERISELGGARLFLPTTTTIDGTLNRKIHAIEAYASQIDTLFGDRAAMARSVSEYASGLQPETGTYGERLWMRR